jgi:glycosyltransferase involved in cell wall biosynthesis
LAAVHAGVPVVAPQGGLVADLLGDAAVTVPAGDADALDAAVVGLLDDGAVGLPAPVRQRLAGWPDAATVAAELAAWYERVSSVTAAEAVDTPG